MKKTNGIFTLRTHQLHTNLAVFQIITSSYNPILYLCVSFSFSQKKKKKQNMRDIKLSLNALLTCLSFWLCFLVAVSTWGAGISTLNRQGQSASSENNTGDYHCHSSFTGEHHNYIKPSLANINQSGSAWDSYSHATSQNTLPR